jgi:alpha-L-rhamnosidase
MTTIANLLCEYRVNPLGIEVKRPRLSWQMQSDRNGARQTAYRILAASDARWLSEGTSDLWDSGKIESDQSVRRLHGTALNSPACTEVLVWDETGSASEVIAWFEMAC